MAAELAAVIVPPDGLPQGFVQLPRAVLFHPDLTDGAKVLYSALLSYAWDAGQCWPGQARLAEDLGVGERTVQRRIDELQQHGLLAVKRRGQGKTNLYLLRCPGEADDDQAQQECRPLTRHSCRIRTNVVEQDSVEVQPEPPHPPEPVDQADEEDTDSCDSDGPGTAGLVAAGATEAQATELTALGATPEQVQAVLTDAWRQTGARARERELRCPDRYRQACVRNGTEALLWRLRDEPEHAPADEAGEKLAAQEQQHREEFAALRARFDGLAEADRARLIDAARASSPIIAQRPPDSPIVLAAATNFLWEEVRGDV